MFIIDEGKTINSFRLIDILTGQGSVKQYENMRAMSNIDKFLKEENDALKEVILCKKLAS